MSSASIVKGISRKINLAFAGLALAVTAVGIPALAPTAQAISAAPPAVRAIPAPAPPVPATPRAVRAIPGAVRQRSGSSPIALTSYAVWHYRAPRQIARSLLRRFHWRGWQFRYLDRLWEQESGWNRYAANPYSGAYGIPQADPGGVMASAGPGWRWNARTQIRWGLRYIRGRYGSPYWAWQHELVYNWY